MRASELACLEMAHRPTSSSIEYIHQNSCSYNKLSTLDKLLVFAEYIPHQLENLAETKRFFFS